MARVPIVNNLLDTSLAEATCLVFLIFNKIVTSPNQLAAAIMMLIDSQPAR